MLGCMSRATAFLAQQPHSSQGTLLLRFGVIRACLLLVLLQLGAAQARMVHLLLL
jgi:hypothetical protein